MRGGTDLYIFQMAVTGDVKIGRSSNIHRRLGEVQTGCPHKLRILLHGVGLGHRERELHHRLRQYRCRMMKGEWFREDGLGELPVDIYDLIPVEVLEDPDWWRR
jgi:hypothetical protein